MGLACEFHPPPNLLKLTTNKTEAQAVPRVAQAACARRPGVAGCVVPAWPPVGAQFDHAGGLPAWLVPCSSVDLGPTVALLQNQENHHLVSAPGSPSPPIPTLSQISCTQLLAGVKNLFQKKKDKVI